MLITIVCPLYNKAEYLKYTVDSVINQSYSNWELIVVDDGSTDSSLAIVKKYADIDNRISIHQRSDFKSNKGGSVCRNIGIQLAKGTFIMFLDADDILDKECLFNRVKHINQFPYKGFYIFNNRSFYKQVGNFSSKERLIRFKNSIFYKFSKSERLFFIKCFAKYEILWQTSCVVWKPETLMELNGFTEAFQRLQDPELHLRALLHENIHFSSSLFKSKPDVYIRLDPDRRGRHNHLKHFENHKNSVSFFLRFFLKYINTHSYKLNINYFQGFILSTEQIYTDLFYSLSADKKDLLAIMNSFYSEEVIQELISSKYKRFLPVYRFISRFGLIRKFKLNTAFMYCYKFLI